MLATALCGCGRDKEESPSESVSEPVASSEASAAESESAPTAEPTTEAESTENAPTAETSAEAESAETAPTAEPTSEAESAESAAAPATSSEAENTESAPTPATSSEVESVPTPPTPSEPESTPAATSVTEPKTDTSAVSGKKYANDMFEYEHDANIGGIRITKYIGKLPDVVIPSKLDGKPVKAVGKLAFSEGFGETASRITSVEIPDGVVAIENSAFNWCSSLKEINIPDSVTTIGEDAFFNCTSLTGTLIVPDSVTSLGYGAFNGCEKLNGIVIGDGVSEIYKYTFSSCGISELTLGKNVSAIDDEAIEMCDGLTTITVDKDNKTYCSKDGVLYNKKMTELIQLVEKINFARVCGQNGLFQQTEAAEAFGGFVMLFNREAP